MISLLETSNECPFCGANSIKKLPISDRVKKIGGGASGAAGPTSGSGSGTIELEPNPDKEPHYKCNGCNKKYVDASLDINIIINNFKCHPIIAMQIAHYYKNKVTLTDLLTVYRTGIVRKPSNFFSPLAEKISKRQLFICFNFNGVRTVGTFVKEKESDIEYYKMKMLGIP